jgi:long-chain acyl-CoA synthetase
LCVQILLNIQLIYKQFNKNLGTTGQAKCVMLSHGNLAFSARTLGQVLAIEEGDSLVSFLPFAHIAEQMLAIHVPVVSRCRVYFAENTAKLHRNMREIQPTLVFAPPELWRKIFLAIHVPSHSILHSSDYYLFIYLII